MYDSPPWVPILWRSAAGDAIKIFPTEKLFHRLGSPSWATDHATSYYLFCNPSPKDCLALWSCQRLVIFYMTLWLGHVVLEVAYKTCFKALHHMAFCTIFHEVPVQLGSLLGASE